MLRLREQHLLASEFHHRSHERALAIQRSFDAATAIVEGLAAYHSASGELTRLEFERYSTALLNRHPVLQALGYNPLITSAKRPGFEATVQAEGFPDFCITERNQDGDIVPAQDRAEYVTVKYIVPIKSNEKAFGFDIYSETTRREAIQLARETRSMAASGPVTLVQETGTQVGYLLIHPVYNEADPSDTPQGFMVGVFRVGALVDSALEDFSDQEIHMDLSDESGEQSYQLHHHPAQSSRSRATSKLAATHIIHLSGRNWVLEMYPSIDFASDQREIIPWLTLLFGLTITAALVAYLVHLRRMTERIAESEKKFRQLADHVNEVFWIIDFKKKRIIYLNQAFERVYQRSVEDVMPDQRALLETIHPGDREEAERNIELLLKGEPRQIKYRIIRPDGRIRLIRDRGFPLVGPHGPTGRVVGLSEDITLRDQIEGERDELQAKITHTQKLEGLGVLASGMAHDYNNLLTAILGHAGRAIEGVPEDSALRRDLMQIEGAGKRAAQLSQQMLIYAGQGHFEHQPLSLTDVVKSMEHLITSTVANKARVQYTLDNNIPPMIGDNNQIRQALLNLTVNAAEANKTLSGTITIATGHLEADKTYLAKSYYDHELVPGTLVFVEISDNGEGMKQEVLGHLFDPFFTTRLVGRGLGLAAVIGIVRGHGGIVVIDTKLNEGSTFRLLFPVAKSTS
jgi:PAS domain S-box-containing protein